MGIQLAYRIHFTPRMGQHDPDAVEGEVYEYWLSLLLLKCFKNDFDGKER